MLLASKNGNISAAILLNETHEFWTLEIEKREVRISKTDNRERAFVNMSDALVWAGAEPELIEYFTALDAAKNAVNGPKMD